jgi:hypothetical protein
MIVSGKDTYLVGRLRVGKWGSWERSSRRVVADWLSGMASITELCKPLGVVGVLDSAVGPMKQRARGHSAGQSLVG